MSVERDMRDAAVDAAWRAHLADEPPPALDDAILAAAHRAVGTTPVDATRAHAAPVDVPRRAAGARWQSWAPLAAAATLAVVAFGIVELAPRDEDRTALSIAPGTTTRDASAPAAPASGAPAPAMSAADSAAGVVAASPPSPKREAQSQLGAEAESRRVPREPVPFPGQAREGATVQSEASAPSNAPARGQRDKVTAEGAMRREDRPLAQPFQITPSAPGEAAERAARAPAPVDDYVRRIALLHAQGADDEAAAVLREFRAAYADADAKLPAALQEWARTVAPPAPEAPPR